MQVYGYAGRMIDTVSQLNDREAVKELLFRLLRSLYLFERLEVENFGLTFQQIYLLKYLRRGSPAPFAEIARELRLKPFGVTRLLDGLEDKGLVARSAGDADRRSRTVDITEGGLELVRRIEDNAFDIVGQNLSDMTGSDIDAVLRVVRDLERLLSVGDAGRDIQDRTDMR